MTKIEELRAELETRKVAKQAEVKELIELTKVTQEINKIDSPLYNKRELSLRDNMVLDTIISTIEEQYAADDRKMSVTFGYGILPNKIITIMKSIQYSKHAEKEELMMMCGVSEQSVEDVLDAFGNTAYYSKNDNTIVESIPMDIAKVKELLALAAIDMQLVSTLDLGKFNSTNVDYQYKRSQLKADEMLENTTKYVETALAYEE